MARLNVITREGKHLLIDAQTGRSVMETMRDGGVDEVLALCGGCCSCATCHVHVDSQWIDRVGPPGPDENDLLDTSDHRLPSSRLSCQIHFDARLDGLTVTVAPESW